MHKRMMLAASAAVLFASAAAFAQNNPSNLEKLGEFKTTGASPNIPTIPQGGAKAAALKKNLEKIKLPHGFHIGALRASSPTRATWRWGRRAS